MYGGLASLTLSIPNEDSFIFTLNRQLRKGVVDDITVKYANRDVAQSLKEEIEKKVIMEARHQKTNSF